MKAKEWVNRFNENNKEDFLKAYAEETAQLIELRTRGSGIIERNDKRIDTRLTAVEGALREQRSKWRSICDKLNTPLLTPEGFDQEILGFYMPDVVLAQKKYKESLQNETVTAPATEIKVTGDGRKLASRLYYIQAIHQKNDASCINSKRSMARRAKRNSSKRRRRKDKNELNNYNKRSAWVW